MGVLIRTLIACKLKHNHPLNSLIEPIYLTGW